MTEIDMYNANLHSYTDGRSSERVLLAIESFATFRDKQLIPKTTELFPEIQDQEGDELLENLIRLLKLAWLGDPFAISHADH